MYQTKVNGVHHELGTSGFLYRSNKVMYDHATKSMWSTLHGEPVVGPLVGKGIKLDRLSLVTTTWGDWKREHPDTTVLSLDTGYGRDYGEGVAYHDYFATDKLMFTVPEIDRRLLNKDQVLALRDEKQQLAIAIKFLIKNPVYHTQLGDQKLVVLTEPNGAARVYNAGDVKFKSWNSSNEAVDSDGQKWRVREDGLVLGEQRLDRTPSHNAFWFGWVSQFPETKLIK